MHNEDIRIRVLKSGLTYREIAKEMGVRWDYLSRIMCRPLSEKNRKKVLNAIQTVEQKKEVQLDD